MAKRGRKRKSEIVQEPTPEAIQELQIQHEDEQKKIMDKMNEIVLWSDVGKSLRDLIVILLALDCQASSITDLFECYGSDIFRAMKTT